MAAPGRSARISRSCAALLALALDACAQRPAPPAALMPARPATASLVGQMRVAGDDGAAAPGVVFLEGLGEPERSPSAPRVKLEHLRGRLVPSFSAAERGSELWVVNRDAIYHAAFSLSQPGGFSFRAYAPGTRFGLRLDRPGVIRVYCRIHEGESATIFVAPGPLARMSRDGHFAFRDVPAGRFVLGAWADGAAGVRREITLRAGERARQDLLLEPERE
jgi:hypothetical protein